MSLNEKMTALADEIRELSGTTSAKSIDAMTTDVNAANTEITEQTELLEQIVNALEGKAGGSSGVTLPELINPASTSDILSGKEAIDGEGNKITGTIATATQAIPSVSIDANGKITASATQTAGYVSAGTKTGSKQLTTQAAKTITPSTSSQTAVAKDVYTTGVVTVAPIPSNYEDVGTETTAYTSLNEELRSVIGALPNAGGGSNGIQYEIVTIDEPSESISFTLNRFTSTIGSFVGESNAVVSGLRPHSHSNMYCYQYNYSGTFYANKYPLEIVGKSLFYSIGFPAPYTAIFINDPSKEALYEEE